MKLLWEHKIFGLKFVIDEVKSALELSPEWIYSYILFIWQQLSFDWYYRESHLRGAPYSRYESVPSKWALLLKVLAEKITAPLEIISSS